MSTRHPFSSRSEPRIDISDWPHVSYVAHSETAMAPTKEASGGKDVLVHATEVTRSAHDPTRPACVETSSRRWRLTSFPWFSPSLIRLGVDYFASQGFEVIDAPPAHVCDDPERIGPAVIADSVSKPLSPHPKAVVIGANGFTAAPAIPALEAQTRRLVLEANQVMLRSVLNGARAAISIRGIGPLFSTPKKKEAGHA